MTVGRHGRCLLGTPRMRRESAAKIESWLLDVDSIYDDVKLELKSDGTLPRDSGKGMVAAIDGGDGS